jgi:hypothetical protein
VRFSGARGLCNEEIPSCAETATDLMNCRRSPQGKIRSGEGTRLKYGRTSSARQEVNKTGRAIQREQHTPRSAAVACAQHELNQQQQACQIGQSWHRRRKQKSNQETCTASTLKTGNVGGGAEPEDRRASGIRPRRDLLTHSEKSE